jgi:hypothetical protein
MSGDDEEAPDPERELPDELMETAVFGAEVERFLDEDRIGKMLVERAKVEMEAAQIELTKIDPEDTKAIRAAQFKYQVADRVVGWLRDVIIDGHTARKVIEEQQ